MTEQDPTETIDDTEDEDPEPVPPDTDPVEEPA